MLPHEVQTKALDILYYVPSWSDKLVKSIVTSMNSKCCVFVSLLTHSINKISDLATSPLILAHFLDICALRQIDAKTALDISLYSSILCTLVLIGYGANEIEVLSQKELSSTSRCYRIKDGLQMKMNNFGKAIKGSKFEWTPEVYWEWRMKKLDVS